MRVDAETQLPSSFVVDYASAADKKAKPVRWLIVAMTTLVSLVAAFLAMLAFDSLKRAQSSAPNA
jgi:cell division septal protein FtsQ